MNTRLALSLLLGIAAAVWTGCDTTPSWPTETQWRRYQHPRLGYTLDVRAACSANEYGDDVIFRYSGDPILCVNVVDAEEGRHRGLWPGKTPSGDVDLSGVVGKKYVYQHCDGPSCMNVVSYVIPFQGRELGVEFRMAGEELGAVQRHVADSFTLGE